MSSPLDKRDQFSKHVAWDLDTQSVHSSGFVSGRNTGSDLNGSSSPGQILASSSPNSLIPTRPVSPYSPPARRGFPRYFPVVHGSPVTPPMSPFQRQEAGKEMVLGNGLSLVALLDRVLENKESADGPEVGTLKRDSTISRSIHKTTARTTRPRPSSSEPSSNDDENVIPIRRPQKCRKTSKVSKAPMIIKKRHTASQDKVIRGLEASATVPDKFINLLMDKLN